MADTLRLTQQCPFAGGACYTITDRGTLQQLTNNRAITALQTVMDSQSARARGGQNLMLNVYNVYAVNPKKFPAVNLQGALAFLDFMTSQAFQDAIARFPSRQRPGFFPAAFPQVKLARQPRRTVSARSFVTLSGTVASAVPGADPLGGISLRLARLPTPVTPVVLDRDSASSSRRVPAAHAADAQRHAVPADAALAQPEPAQPVARAVHGTGERVADGRAGRGRARRAERTDLPRRRSPPRGAADPRAPARRRRARRASRPAPADREPLPRRCQPSGRPMAAEHPLRRPGRRLVRRLARSLGLCAVIAAASAAAPAAAGAAGILVRLPGGERHLTPEEVGAAADRAAGTYLLRAAGTTAEPVAHPPALSVRRLVTLAGASPDALTFVTIERPNGSLAMLGRGDLTDPAPFADGPPIVWMDAGGARYLRPLRGPGDVNATDNVDDHRRRPRRPRAPGAAARACARRPTGTRSARGLRCTSTGEVVSGAGAGLTYTWRFGDGASSERAGGRARLRRARASTRRS